MEFNFSHQTGLLDGYHQTIVKSGYNNEITVWEREDKQKLVVRRPVKLSQYIPEAIVLTPFLSPNNLEKEFAILRFLEAKNLPIAKCIYHEPYNLSVYELASGEELDFQNYSKRTVEDRNRIGNNLGKFIGKFHNSQHEVGSMELIAQIPGRFGHVNPRNKHLWRLEASTGFLKRQGVIQEKEAKKIKFLGLKEHKVVPDTEFHLVHGDLYSRNIFIDPKILDITAVLDWIDASEVDDPLTDLLLTARWYGFNDNLTDTNISSNINAFYSVIQGYYKESNFTLDQDYLRLYKFYDLLWHLRVLVAEQVKGNNQAVRQYKGTLYSLLELMS